MTKTEIIENCRSCDSNKLAPILSLGNQYVTNFIYNKEEQNSIPQVPLELILCEDCKLLQLKHNAPPESMWGDQYWYKSGISSTIRDDLEDIVNKNLKLKHVKENDLIVDIGCNDGTMLDFYNKKGISSLVGFEPSGNVAEEAKEKGHYIVNDFFNAENFKEKFGDRKAKIITAISMFYDLENPNKFLDDIVSVLDQEGLFVIQQNYLLTMLEQNAFDNICHEHREYYSLHSLKNILEKHNLEIFDVEQNNINGGSIRTYIRFKGAGSLEGFSESGKRIKELIEKEKQEKLDTLTPYEEFALRISNTKEKLLSFLKQEKEKGKKISVYGASTRGNVTLQYFGLDSNLIECAADKNPDKWGKKTVGSLIPIVSPEDMRKIKPDYLLVNTWHFFDEIKKQEQEYLNGKFIVALPEFEIINKD